MYESAGIVAKGSGSAVSWRPASASPQQRIPSRVPGGTLTIAVLAECGYNTLALNTLFDAAVEATEEAVINALLAATTAAGHGGRVPHAVPHDPLRGLLSR